jgi:hypothetical protein
MMAGANRGAELYYLKFKIFERLNENKYLIRFTTAKAHTSRTIQADSSIISGYHEIKIIREYLACFNPDQMTSECRFFMKINKNMKFCRQLVKIN